MVEIRLGDTVKCKYTGLKGVAKTEFVNGCALVDIAINQTQAEVVRVIEERLSICYKTRDHYLADVIKSEKWQSIIIILEGLYKEITGRNFK